MFSLKQPKPKLDFFNQFSLPVEYYLRFDVSMENSISVHVIDGLQHLVHVVLDALLWKIVATTFNGFVHVHVHQFEYKGKSSCRFITIPVIDAKVRKRKNNRRGPSLKFSDSDQEPVRRSR